MSEPQRSRHFAASAPFVLFAVLAHTFHLSWAALAFQALGWLFVIAIGLSMMLNLWALSMFKPTEQPVFGDLSPTVDAGRLWDTIWWTVHVVAVSLCALWAGWISLAVAYPLMGSANHFTRELSRRYRQAMARA